MADIGAEHGDTDAHQQHDEDIVPTRPPCRVSRSRPSALKTVMANPNVGAMRRAADQIGWMRAGCRNRSTTVSGCSSPTINGRADDPAPVDEPDIERHRVECRERTDDRRDQRSDVTRQERQGRRPGSGTTETVVDSHLQVDKLPYISIGYCAIRRVDQDFDAAVT
jgi:hypothetical protein